MPLALSEEVSTIIRALVEKIAPAVVGINRRGSGVVIADGLVATNVHNLDGPEVAVTFAGGQTATGNVAGADVDRDIAVIRVETAGIVPFVDASRQSEVGDVVFGLSRPGGRELRVTVGTVSSLGRAFRGPRGRRVSGGLEHTAPLPRGSSGGPVVDRDGRLVGLNTHRVEDGFYVALPAGDALRTFVEQAASGDLPNRRTLGVAVMPPHVARRLRATVGLPPIDAPLVRGVIDASPAAQAGIRRGDVIVRADDNTIASVDDLHRALDGVGSTIRFGIVRGTDEIEVLVDFDATDAQGGEA